MMDSLLAPFVKAGIPKARKALKEYMDFPLKEGETACVMVVETREAGVKILRAALEDRLGSTVVSRLHDSCDLDELISKIL